MTLSDLIFSNSLSPPFTNTLILCFNLSYHVFLFDIMSKPKTLRTILKERHEPSLYFISYPQTPVTPFHDAPIAFRVKIWSRTSYRARPSRGNRHGSRPRIKSNRFGRGLISQSRRQNMSRSLRQGDNYIIFHSNLGSSRFAQFPRTPHRNLHPLTLSAIPRNFPIQGQFDNGVVTEYFAYWEYWYDWHGDPKGSCFEHITVQESWRIDYCCFPCRLKKESCI